MMSYRDYLIWEASAALAALSESLSKAMKMDDPYNAERVLEHALDTQRLLCEYRNYNPDRVSPPTRKEDET